MTEINLKPYARKFNIAPDDAWVFKMIFREMIEDVATPIDIRGFDITAKLYHFFDNQWNTFLTFQRRKDVPDMPNLENAIYFDRTDQTNSTAIFAFDWIATQPENSQNLQNGLYRLVFQYSSPIGYKKTFLMYEVNIDTEIRPDGVPFKHNAEFVLIEPVPNVTIQISNTRIS